MEQVAAKLAALGLSQVGLSGTSVNVVTVKDAAQAEALNFAGSPTILVDGVGVPANKTCGLTTQILPHRLDTP